MNRVPTHDDAGLHLLDPNDARGYKSAYITLLHKKALRRHIPKGSGEIAVDLGCGFGRLTHVLGERGWRAIGIDPSAKLLEYARRHYPGPEYLQGGLPALPFAPGSIHLLLFQNVLRPLKVMGRLDRVPGFGQYLVPGATVLVVENLRLGHPDFLPEDVVIDLMTQEHLRLVERIPLRASRWWVVYLIRYGLIPRSWFERIAEWELNRMCRRSGVPRWQYWNVLFVFKKAPISNDDAASVFHSNSM